MRRRLNFRPLAFVNKITVYQPVEMRTVRFSTLPSRNPVTDDPR
jgi:hypothetical protein